MALTIATDYGYLRAEQAMNTANTMREHAMQRLSTGSKLNSAADNAAGVAIASRMTANVTAMRQAMTNAADAQGLLGTAEGGMVEMENIVQRMRELVTQAANDTLNSGDRSKVKVEMDQLVDELDRIAATTTWAGETLFNGGQSIPNLATSTADTKKLNFMIGGGSSKFDTIGVDLKALTAEALNVKGNPVAPAMIGSVVDAASTADAITATKTNAISGTVKIDAGFNAGDTYSMKINGHTVSITASSSDGYSDNTVGLNMQMADAINNLSGAIFASGSGAYQSSEKGFFAAYNSTDGDVDITYTQPIISDVNDEANASSPTFTSPSATSLKQTDKTKDGNVTINGTTVQIDAVVTTNYADSLKGWDLQQEAAITAAVKGVSVTHTTDGTLVLASDLTFTDVTSTATATAPGIDVNSTTGEVAITGSPSIGDKIKLTIDTKVVEITVGDDGYANNVQGVASQLQDAINDQNISGLTVKNNFTRPNPSIVSAALATGMASFVATIGTVASSEDNIINVTAKGTSNGTVAVDIGGVTYTTASIDVSTENTIAKQTDKIAALLNADASFAAKYIATSDNMSKITLTSVDSTLTDGSILITKGGALSISDNETARGSLATLGNALETISTARAELGSVLNRLDSAIANLTNISVNTEISRSKITDADYASEMSNLTTAQILEKATTAMMAQANASKQDVLQLLQ